MDTPDGLRTFRVSRITLSVQFDDEEQARFIALGSRADVIGPAALRERVQADRVAGARTGT